MISEITIEDALVLNWPIIDVRSPSEFNRGHIIESYNIPLFSNEERAHVGTVYKQQSKEKAIAIGYQYVEPKLEFYTISSQKVAPKGKVIVHCWRGGMRSHSFAKHLTENGFTEVKVIVGGYKAFRNYVLHSFSRPANLKVLGGYTGSGKTFILNELQKRGHQVIDLERIANHKGSVFGGIDQNKQPTVEQFENNLFKQWRVFNLENPIWIEDESHRIGKVSIPMQLFKQMRIAQLYFIEIPKEERTKHLVTEYSKCDDLQLKKSIYKIEKRLGGLNVKNAVEALNEQNYYEVAKITLQYYDKLYLKGLNKRDSKNVIKMALPTIHHYKNALKIEKLLEI
jgi:tRNA 2-selenouridine synthase